MRLLVALWVLVMGGCALPQEFEERQIVRDGFVVAKASRLTGWDDNPVDEMRVNLRTAPAFSIRLPDGTWVGSKDISRQMLADHGFTFHGTGPEHAVWHPPFSPGTIAGRYLYMNFEVHGERVRALEMGSCGWTFDAVLRSADGRRSYGFPIGVSELESLLGPSSVVRRVDILTRPSCL